MTHIELQRLPSFAAPGACAAVIVGVVYCQAHGALSGAQAPLAVSLWWSASGLLPLLAAAGAAVRSAAALRRRPIAGAALLALLFSAAVAAGEVAYGGALLRWDAWASAAFRALPAGAGLAAVAVAALRLLAPAPGPAGPEPRVPCDVALVRSAGNYLSLETGGRETLIRLPLHEAARRLAPHGFVQAHRTALVNLARIVDMRRDGRRLVLQLDDGRTVTVGRAYADAVRSSLGRRRSSQDL